MKKVSIDVVTRFFVAPLRFDRSLSMIPRTCQIHGIDNDPSVHRNRLLWSRWPFYPSSPFSTIVFSVFNSSKPLDKVDCIDKRSNVATPNKESVYRGLSLLQLDACALFTIDRSWTVELDEFVKFQIDNVSTLRREKRTSLSSSILLSSVFSVIVSLSWFLETDDLVERINEILPLLYRAKMNTSRHGSSIRPSLVTPLHF